MTGILLDCETFWVVVDEITAVRKVNLRRIVETEDRTMDGLEITFRSGRQLEVDYLRGEQRDQVYAALFRAMAKTEGVR